MSQAILEKERDYWRSTDCGVEFGREKSERRSRAVACAHSCSHEGFKNTELFLACANWPAVWRLFGVLARRGWRTALQGSCEFIAAEVRSEVGPRKVQRWRDRPSATAQRADGSKDAGGRLKALVDVAVGTELALQTAR